MGARAQEAVSFRSQLKEVDLLRLLGVLAAGADDDTGLIDPAPGRETLAGIFGCTERTVTNRMNRLLESGELEVVRVGSGPGRPSAYRLLLTIPEVTCFNEERVKKGEKSSPLEARVAALETGLAELKGEIDAKFFTLLQAIEELKGEISELKGEKGGNEEPERVKRVKGKGESLPEVECRRSFFDPSFDPGDTPPTPPSGGDGANDSPEDLALWGDILSTCEGNQGRARAVLVLASELQDLLLWVKPKPSSSRRARDQAKTEWWHPLVQVLKSCEWQSDMARQRFVAATQAMRGREMSPARPSAVIGEIGRMTAVTNGDVIAPAVTNGHGARKMSNAEIVAAALADMEL